MLAKKKREERAKLVADARAILDAVPEGETLSAEKEAEYNKIMAKVDGMKGEIDRLERQAAVEAELGETAQQRAGRENISEDEAKAKMEREKRACNAYIRFGMQGVPEELRAIAQGMFRNAQSGESGAGGGYMVTPEFTGQIIEAEASFGAMLVPGVCDIINSTTGAPMSFVTDNDTTNEGALIGENAQVTQQDVSVGQITLDGYTFSSKIVLVPISLLEDSAYPIEPWLARKFAMRLGRIKNRMYTTGDGAKKPTGAAYIAPVGVTAASQTVIQPDEVIDLEHSVDPAYRPNAKYMFHDDVLKHLRKKKDGQGRYLWQEGLKSGAPDTINNKPYIINQHMAGLTTGNKTMLYGDFMNYTIRNIGATRVLRLVERYADYNQVGFVAFERADGNLLDAGTHPIKSLAMA